MRVLITSWLIKTNLLLSFFINYGHIDSNLVRSRAGIRPGATVNLLAVSRNLQVAVKLLCCMVVLRGTLPWAFSPLSLQLAEKNSCTFAFERRNKASISLAERRRATEEPVNTSRYQGIGAPWFIGSRIAGKIALHHYACILSLKWQGKSSKMEETL